MYALGKETRRLDWARRSPSGSGLPLGKPTRSRSRLLHAIALVTPGAAELSFRSHPAAQITHRPPRRVLQERRTRHRTPDTAPASRGGRNRRRGSVPASRVGGARGADAKPKPPITPAA